MDAVTLIETIDWTRILTAYGSATDAPPHLRALLEENSAGWEDADSYLRSAVVHQETLFPAAPSVINVLLATLWEPHLAADAQHIIVCFLDYVGESAAQLHSHGLELTPQHEAELQEFWQTDIDAVWELDATEVFMDQAIQDTHDLSSSVIKTLLLLEPRNITNNTALASALAWWSKVPNETAQQLQAQVSSRIRHMLDHARTRDDHAALVMLLGEIGDDISSFLDDPDEAIAASAAVYCDTPEAIELLIDALQRPCDYTAWFAEQPRPYRFSIPATYIAALLARNITFENLLPAALAIAESARGGVHAQYEWGPLLYTAMKIPPEHQHGPIVERTLPAPLTPAQQKFLQALADNDALWNPTDANAMTIFRRAGVPTDPRQIHPRVR